MEARAVPAQQEAGGVVSAAPGLLAGPPGAWGQDLEPEQCTWVWQGAGALEWVGGTRGLQSTRLENQLPPTRTQEAQRWV